MHSAALAAARGIWDLGGQTQEESESVADQPCTHGPVDISALVRNLQTELRVAIEKEWLRMLQLFMHGGEPLS